MDLRKYLWVQTNQFFWDLFKNAESNGKTISTCVGYTDSGEEVVYEDVYVYYSDNYEVGMGFKFNSEDKVEIIFVLYGL